MTIQVTNRDSSGIVAPPVPVVSDNTSGTSSFRQAEETRIRSLVRLAELAHAPSDALDRAIEAETTVEATRDEFMAAAAAGQAAEGIAPRGQEVPRYGEGGSTGMRTSVANALAHRTQVAPWPRSRF